MVLRPLERLLRRVYSYIWRGRGALHRVERGHYSGHGGQNRALRYHKGRFWPLRRYTYTFQLLPMGLWGSGAAAGAGGLCVYRLYGAMGGVPCPYPFTTPLYI